MGQAAGTHILGDASLVSAALHSAGSGHGHSLDTGATMALMPGSCWPPAVVQARGKHTTAAPWEKPHHLPVTDASRL